MKGLSNHQRNKLFHIALKMIELLGLKLLGLKGASTKLFSAFQIMLNEALKSYKK